MPLDPPAELQIGQLCRHFARAAVEVADQLILGQRRGAEPRQDLAMQRRGVAQAAFLRRGLGHQRQLRLRRGGGAEAEEGEPGTSGQEGSVRAATDRGDQEEEDKDKEEAAANKGPRESPPAQADSAHQVLLRLHMLDAGLAYC